MENSNEQNTSEANQEIPQASPEDTVQAPPDTDVTEQVDTVPEEESSTPEPSPQGTKKKSILIALLLIVLVIVGYFFFIKPSDSTVAGIAKIFLPYFVIFLIIPIAMLLVGKMLSVVSDKLTYSRLLWITFVGSLLGGFVRELHSYALIGVFFVIVLWMIKKQLEINWGKAFAMTMGGLIAGGLMGYGASFITANNIANDSSLGLPTSSNVVNDNEPDSPTPSIAKKYDSSEEKYTKHEVEVELVEEKSVTALECFNKSKVKAGKFEEVKFNQVFFSQLYKDEAGNSLASLDAALTGDGYSDNCMASYYIGNNEYFYVHILKGQVKSFKYDVRDPNESLLPVDDLEIGDSLIVLDTLKKDDDFKKDLDEALDSSSDLSEKDVIALKRISYDRKFKQYIWIVELNKEIGGATYTLDLAGKTILKKVRWNDSGSFESIDGDWVEMKRPSL